MHRCHLYLEMPVSVREIFRRAAAALLGNHKLPLASYTWLFALSGTTPGGVNEYASKFIFEAAELGQNEHPKNARVKPSTGETVRKFSRVPETLIASQFSEPHTGLIKEARYLLGTVASYIFFRG